MKIFTPIKRVPDPYAKVRVTEEGRLDSEDLKYTINPFDEIALEEALRLREAGEETDITAVAVGNETCVDQLRQALAMGADRAILIETEAEADAMMVSIWLAELCRQEKPDLVLMGKQSTDEENSQVGPRLAGLLQWGQATFASKIEADEGAHALRVTREVEDGRETLQVALPAVVTVDLRLNEPRYVALPAILRARSKPLQRIAASDLAEPVPGIELLALETPPPRAPGRMAASLDEFCSLLQAALNAR